MSLDTKRHPNMYFILDTAVRGPDWPRVLLGSSEAQLGLASALLGSGLAGYMGLGARSGLGQGPAWALAWLGLGLAHTLRAIRVALLPSEELVLRLALRKGRRNFFWRA